MIEGNIPSVTELLVERIRSNSQPHDRRDPYRLAYVPEGGAQRTIYSAGGTTALQSFDALSAFDTIHAVSGGAPVGAYFGSSQTPDGTAIITDYLASKRYVNPARLLHGGPALDIDYARSIMKNVVPLDWQKLQDSGVPLHIYLTDAATGQKVDRSTFDSREDIIDALTDTMRVPIVTGWPFTKNSGNFIDGGIATSGLPLQEAILDNATHVLVWHTQPDGVTIKHSNFLDALGAAIFKPRYPELAATMRRSSHKYHAALRMLEYGKSKRGNVLIEKICPLQSEQNIGRFERRRPAMIRGANLGYQITQQKLEKYNLRHNPDVSVRT